MANSPSLLKRCPDSRMYFRIIVDGDDKNGPQDLTYFTRCKSWACPYCARVNANLLRGQLRRACRSLWESERKDGYRIEYFFKFLTLTVPGAAYRQIHTPEEAEIELKKNLRLLLTSMRNKLGWFEYVWVMETHADGFPHIHMLLIGESISSVDLLRYVEALWRKKYSMGFIRMNTARNGADGIVNYLTKYMTKGLSSGLSGNRVYGMSKRIRAAKNLPKRSCRVVEFGQVVFDPVSGSERLVPDWVVADDSPGLAVTWDREEGFSQETLHELLEFFERKRIGAPEEQMEFSF